jgi:hypothetical protein
MASTSATTMTTTFSMSQQKALAICPKVTAMLSFLGSSLVAVQVIHKQRRKEGNNSGGGNKKSNKSMNLVYRRLVLGMSCADIVSSAAFFCSTWLIPASLSEESYGAMGTQGTCTAQGFFAHFTLLSVFYNSCLAMYYYLVIGKGWNDKKMSKQTRPEAVGHVVVTLYCLVTGVVAASLQMFNSVGWACWIAASPPGCVERWQASADHPASCERGDNATLFLWVAIYVPMWVAIGFSTTMMSLVYRSVRSIEQRAMKYNINVATSVGASRASNGSRGGSKFWKKGARNSSMSRQSSMASMNVSIKLNTSPHGSHRDMILEPSSASLPPVSRHHHSSAHTGIDGAAHVQEQERPSLISQLSAARGLSISASALPSQRYISTSTSNSARSSTRHNNNNNNMMHRPRSRDSQEALTTDVSHVVPSGDIDVRRESGVSTAVSRNYLSEFTPSRHDYRNNSVSNHSLLSITRSSMNSTTALRSRSRDSQEALLSNLNRNKTISQKSALSYVSNSKSSFLSEEADLEEPQRHNPSTYSERHDHDHEPAVSVRRNTDSGDERASSSSIQTDNGGDNHEHDQSTRIRDHGRSDTYKKEIDVDDSSNDINAIGGINISTSLASLAAAAVPQAPLPRDAGADAGGPFSSDATSTMAIQQAPADRRRRYSQIKSKLSTIISQSYLHTSQNQKSDSTGTATGIGFSRSRKKNNHSGSDIGIGMSKNKNNSTGNSRANLPRAASMSGGAGIGIGSPPAPAVPSVPRQESARRFNLHRLISRQTSRERRRSQPQHEAAKGGGNGDGGGGDLVVEVPLVAPIVVAVAELSPTSSSPKQRTSTTSSLGGLRSRIRPWGSASVNSFKDGDSRLGGGAASLTNSHNSRDQAFKKSRKVANQAILYVGALYLTWMFPTLQSIVYTTTSNRRHFGLLLLESLLVPTVGVWNLIMYLRPTYLRCRKRYSSVRALKLWQMLLLGKSEHEIKLLHRQLVKQHRKQAHKHLLTRQRQLQSHLQKHANATADGAVCVNPISSSLQSFRSSRSVHTPVLPSIFEDKGGGRRASGGIRAELARQVAQEDEQENGTTTQTQAGGGGGGPSFVSAQKRASLLLKQMSGKTKTSFDPSSSSHRSSDFGSSDNSRSTHRSRTTRRERLISSWQSNYNNYPGRHRIGDRENRSSQGSFTPLDRDEELLLWQPTTNADHLVMAGRAIPAAGRHVRGDIEDHTHNNRAGVAQGNKNQRLKRSGSSAGSLSGSYRAGVAQGNKNHRLKRSGSSAGSLSGSYSRSNRSFTAGGGYRGGSGGSLNKRRGSTASLPENQIFQLQRPKNADAAGVMGKNETTDEEDMSEFTTPSQIPRVPSSVQIRPHNNDAMLDNGNVNANEKFTIKRSSLTSSVTMDAPSLHSRYNRGSLSSVEFMHVHFSNATEEDENVMARKRRTSSITMGDFTSRANAFYRQGGRGSTESFSMLIEEEEGRVHDADEDVEPYRAAEEDHHSGDDMDMKDGKSHTASVGEERSRRTSSRSVASSISSSTPLDADTVKRARRASSITIPGGGIVNDLPGVILLSAYLELLDDDEEEEDNDNDSDINDGDGDDNANVHTTNNHDVESNYYPHQPSVDLNSHNNRINNNHDGSTNLAVKEGNDNDNEIYDDDDGDDDDIEADHHNHRDYYHRDSYTNNASFYGVSLSSLRSIPEGKVPVDGSALVDVEGEGCQHHRHDHEGADADLGGSSSSFSNNASASGTGTEVDLALPLSLTLEEGGDEGSATATASDHKLRTGITTNPMAKPFACAASSASVTVGGVSHHNNIGAEFECHNHTSTQAQTPLHAMENVMEKETEIADSLLANANANDVEQPMAVSSLSENGKSSLSVQDTSISIKEAATADTTSTTYTDFDVVRDHGRQNMNDEEEEEKKESLMMGPIATTTTIGSGITVPLPVVAGTRTAKYRRRSSSSSSKSLAASPDIEV